MPYGRCETRYFHNLSKLYENNRCEIDGTQNFSQKLILPVIINTHYLQNITHYQKLKTTPIISITKKKYEHQDAQNNINVASINFIEIQISISTSLQVTLIFSLIFLPQILWQAHDCIPRQQVVDS